MSKWNPAPALLFVALISTACSSDEKGQTATNDALSEDANEFVNALCERLEDCSKGAPLFSSRAGCVVSLMARYDCDAGWKSAQIAELADCVNALESAACAVILAEPLVPTICRPALVSLERQLGYRLPEESCGFYEHCVAGVSCHLEEECGVCKTGTVAGDACDDFCDDALFCNDSGKCEALRGVGADCETSQQCFSRDCSEGKCVTPQPGDACVEGFYCGDFMRCVDSTCAALAKIGDACEQFDGGGPVCTYDAVCVEGRCRAMASCGQGKIGSPCSSDGQCEDGFTCSGITERCIARGAEGEPCMVDDVYCAEGLVCGLEPGEDAGICRKPTADDPEPEMC